MSLAFFVARRASSFLVLLNMAPLFGGALVINLSRLDTAKLSLRKDDMDSKQGSEICEKGEQKFQQDTDEEFQQGTVMQAEQQYMRQHYSFDGDFKINGTALLLEQPASNVGHNYGRSVWEGGIVMARYLEKETLTGSLAQFAPVRGLELGSGTGVGGLSLGLVGGDVILTDKEAVKGETLPTATNLEKNIEKIKEVGGSAEFKALDWANLPTDALSFLGNRGPVNVIFGSDLFGSWSTDPEGPNGCPHCGRLAAAIAWAHQSSPEAKIVLSYTKRESNALDIFTEELEKQNLVIGEKESAGEGHDNIFLLHIAPVAGKEKDKK